MTKGIAVLGIDLEKNSYSVVESDGSGSIVRENIIKSASSLAQCVMAKEACCGVHRVFDIGLAVRCSVSQVCPSSIRSRAPDDE